VKDVAVRQRLGFNVDLQAAGLVVLFGAVIGGALLLRPTAIASGSSPAFQGSSTSTQVAGGIIWAIAEAIFAVILLSLLVLWRRLPAWVQTSLSRALAAGVLMMLGAYGILSSQFLLLTGLVVGTVASVYALDSFDLWWIGNDVLALAVAVYIGVLAGVVLGPVVIAAGLIGLTAYDYLFADREDWMFQLAGWTVRRRFPMLFLVPSTTRLDWVVLSKSFDEDTAVETDAVLRFGVGTADLALPAAFAVALAQAGGGLPLFGALAGLVVACGRISHKLEQGGGAGLPPIVSGTLGGWLLALIPGVIGAWI